MADTSRSRARGALPEPAFCPILPPFISDLHHQSIRLVTAYCTMTRSAICPSNVWSAPGTTVRLFLRIVLAYCTTTLADIWLSSVWSALGIASKLLLRMSLEYCTTTRGLMPAMEFVKPGSMLTEVSLTCLALLTMIASWGLAATAMASGSVIVAKRKAIIRAFITAPCKLMQDRHIDSRCKSIVERSYEIGLEASGSLSMFLGLSPSHLNNHRLYILLLR